MTLSAISIEPYFDPEIPNMGFEKYGLSTAPGSEVTEYISKDRNGRYITGLDENSPTVMYMEDLDEKKARLKEIKEVVIRLESIFGKNSLEALNDTLWGEFNIKLDYTGKSLDKTNPKDELLYFAIKAGGFEAIAPSIEKAKEGDYKFYLRQMEHDSDLKVERVKMINKAKAALTDLDETDSQKMLLVAKSVLAPNNEFTDKTPKSIIYDKLDQFIDGKIVKDNKKATVRHFLEAYKKSLNTLTIEALVKDALYFSFIVREGDGNFYNKQTEVRLGKTEKDIIKYLESPINQVEFENIKDRVDAKFYK